MTTARSYLAGFGIETSAVAAGGGEPSISAATEEFTGAFNAIRTVTTS
jgi:hypothetical protein